MNGITVYGEAPHWRHAALGDEELTPLLLTADAADIERCSRRAVPPFERTRKFAAACAEFGFTFYFYSGDSGIGMAASLHRAGSDPYLDRPSHSLLRWYADDVIEGGPFAPKQGIVSVPEEPDVGVRLDPRALRRCAEHFEHNGPLEQLGLDPATDCTDDCLLTSDGPRG